VLGGQKKEGEKPSYNNRQTSRREAIPRQSKRRLFSVKTWRACWVSMQSAPKWFFSSLSSSRQPRAFLSPSRRLWPRFKALPAKQPQERLLENAPQGRAGLDL